MVLLAQDHGLALPGALGAVVAACLLALCLVWLELVRRISRSGKVSR